MRGFAWSCVVVGILLAALTGCASSTSNALRNTFQPVALQGQSDAQLTADSEACRAIGYRAGQGLDYTTRHGDAGSVLIGSGAGTLAGGSTGGAAGGGAAVVIGTAMDVRQRGQYMHAAYQDCMRERGYRGARD